MRSIGASRVMFMLPAQDPLYSTVNSLLGTLTDMHPPTAVSC